MMDVLQLSIMDERNILGNDAHMPKGFTECKRYDMLSPKTDRGKYKQMARLEKECQSMAKDRFVESYSQGATNVRKIIVDTATQRASSGGINDEQA